MESARSQKPLEFILARNLLTSISTPGFLLDSDAALVFYNEAAAALLGRTFEEAGRMDAEQWTTAFGLFADDGEPIAVDGLATTEAIRAGVRPDASFTIRSANGSRHSIEVKRIPDRHLRQGFLRSDDPLLAARLAERERDHGAVKRRCG